MNKIDKKSAAIVKDKKLQEQLGLNNSKPNLAAAAKEFLSNPGIANKNKKKKKNSQRKNKVWETDLLNKIVKGEKIDAPETPSKKIDLVQGFMNLLIRLMNGICTSFPHCKASKGYLEKIKEVLQVKTAQEMLIKQWQEQMQPFMEDISSGNIAKILKKKDSELPKVLTLIGFREKLDKLDDEDGTETEPSSRQKVINVIAQLNDMSNLVKFMSNDIRSSIENTAAYVQEKTVKEGKGLNASDFPAIGMMVVKNVKKENVEEFIKNIPDLYEKIDAEDAIQSIFKDSKLVDNMNQMMDRIKTDPIIRSKLLDEVENAKEGNDGNNKDTIWEPDF